MNEATANNTTLDTSEVLQANAGREAALFAPYDPTLGVGSPLERVDVCLHGSTTVAIPRVMLEGSATQEPSRLIQDIAGAGSLEKLASDGGSAWHEEIAFFDEERFRYDFEFWASECAHIKVDAETREQTGIEVAPIKLNQAQLVYLVCLTAMFDAGEPIRVILLKARQWGGSTLTQLFMAWVQLYHRRAWNTFICTLTLTQAGHIREMYDLLRRHYPLTTGFSFAPYQNSQNVKYIPERDSIVGVTSIERPNNPRSFSIHMAHLSEVGLWPSRPKVNAESFADAITGAVPEVPLTIIVEESTAKGAGTYFHKHWQRAERGVSKYAPMFIPWYHIPKYHKPVAEAGRAEFVRSWDDYEAFLWRKGASVSQINWYRDKLAGFKGRRSKMKAEFPTTPQEAFQYTGDRYFEPDSVERMRAKCSDPATGVLKADAREGKKAFENIRFLQRDLPSEDVGLHIWRQPDDDYGGLVKADMRYRNRFCGYADFGGKTERADWSVLTIIDRFMMLYGGVPEVVARLRVHLRPDLFAWQSARLAYWYDKALLAYETNRHSKDRGDDERGYEPEWSMAVLDEIGAVYPNLYLRKSQDRIDEPHSKKIGYHMTGGGKEVLINGLDAALDDEKYIERGLAACAEFDLFEKKTDGRLGAVSGYYDDIVISTAGALWLALSYMPAVVAVPKERKRQKREPSMAKF